MLTRFIFHRIFIPSFSLYNWFFSQHHYRITMTVVFFVTSPINLWAEWKKNSFDLFYLFILYYPIRLSFFQKYFYHLHSDIFFSFITTKVFPAFFSRVQISYSRAQFFRCTLFSLRFLSLLKTTLYVGFTFDTAIPTKEEKRQSTASGIQRWETTDIFINI